MNTSFLSKKPIAVLCDVCPLFAKEFHRKECA